MMVYFIDVCFFFFSSRRRHTRCLSDWSSDVCSSDLRSMASVIMGRSRMSRMPRGNGGPPSKSLPRATWSSPTNWMARPTTPTHSSTVKRISCDQHLAVHGGAADERGEREQEQPGDERAPPSEQVGGAPAEHQEAGEGDRVGVDHPLQLGA